MDLLWSDAAIRSGDARIIVELLLQMRKVRLCSGGERRGRH